MKNLVNRDFEKLQTTATVEPMFRQEHKMMPYERLLLVNAKGKYSSKQCDKKRNVSHAQYLRRRSINETEKALEEEIQELLAEDSLLFE